MTSILERVRCVEVVEANVHGNARVESRYRKASKNSKKEFPARESNPDLSSTHRNVQLVQSLVRVPYTNHCTNWDGYALPIGQNSL